MHPSSKEFDPLLCRLRKDLAAFLGLELPSLPALAISVEEEKEKKERRKNLATYLGVEENVLSTILPPPPPPPSTLANLSKCILHLIILTPMFLVRLPLLTLPMVGT